jgi:hypothetical protein
LKQKKKNNKVLNDGKAENLKIAKKEKDRLSGQDTLRKTTGGRVGKASTKKKRATTPKSPSASLTTSPGSPTTSSEELAEISGSADDGAPAAPHNYSHEGEAIGDPAGEEWDDLVDWEGGSANP